MKKGWLRGNKEEVKFKEFRVEEQVVMVSEYISYKITCGILSLFRLIVVIHIFFCSQLSVAPCYCITFSEIHVALQNRPCNKLFTMTSSNIIAFDFSIC